MNEKPKLSQLIDCYGIIAQRVNINSSSSSNTNIEQTFAASTTSHMATAYQNYLRHFGGGGGGASYDVSDLYQSHQYHEDLISRHRQHQYQQQQQQQQSHQQPQQPSAVNTGVTTTTTTAATVQQDTTNIVPISPSTYTLQTGPIGGPTSLSPATIETASSFYGRTPDTSSTQQLYTAQPHHVVRQPAIMSSHYRYDQLPMEYHHHGQQPQPQPQQHHHYRHHQPQPQQSQHLHHHHHHHQQQQPHPHHHYQYPHHQYHAHPSQSQSHHSEPKLQTKSSPGPMLNKLIGTVAKHFLNDERDRKYYSNVYSCMPPPVFILSITLIELIFFSYYAVANQVGVTSNGPIPIDSMFIYRPDKRTEVWRFFLYMVLHAGWLHLLFNLLVQLLVGLPLEMVHGSARIGAVYMSGVLAGSLATSVFDSEVYLVGASGGVYALLAAHLANILLNYNQIDLGFARLIGGFVVISVDVGIAIYNRYATELHQGSISYVAHLAGALAGLTIGLLVLKNFEQKLHEQLIWWVALGVYVACILFALVFNIFY